ncbi:MAG TPA: PTS sugar transporter subunit IIA [Thermoanaerobaculia bacterium]|nr:PTS sugar transporter subunit IIA [Thermoanaerobaculia bacterium]
MTAQPTPESFLRLIHRSRRGRLKVYLGYGPGVGKTYQLLLEGQRLKATGVDVVAGFVETHGRADTASLLLGLEEVPRREVVYRGVRLAEMDLPAILARRPEVVLIDELAHTNVPGSGNVKRYQDVQEVLAAGIHVITTVNVQHLESLYDTVERLIGVRVKERVPDWVIAEADEVVNIDLATEDLQRRLTEGRVYTPERASQALDHFFRKGNLEQLRELAFREAAAAIERKGRGLPDQERVQAPDQVVVCLSSRSPDVPALLRYTSRLAGRLNRNWYALYVETPAEDPAQLAPATRAALKEALTLATQLGAMVFTYKGDDVVDTILRFAREYRVGHVVVGRPTPRPLWRRLVRRGGLDLPRLVAEARGLAVVVVDASPSAPAAPPVSPMMPMPPSESERPGSRPAAATGSRLSDLLAEPAVLVFPEPIGKGELLGRLVTAVAGSPPAFDAADVLRRIERREGEASTFLSEGIALPHVRVPGLRAARVGLALPRAPSSEPAGERASGLAGIEAVFLFLCPEESPDLCLNLLATAARLFRDPASRAALGRAGSAGEALQVIQAWEGYPLSGKLTV